MEFPDRSDDPDLCRILSDFQITSELSCVNSEWILMFSLLICVQLQSAEHYQENKNCDFGVYTHRCTVQTLSEPVRILSTLPSRPLNFLCGQVHHVHARHPGICANMSLANKNQLHATNRSRYPYLQMYRLVVKWTLAAVGCDPCASKMCLASVAAPELSKLALNSLTSWPLFSPIHR